MENACKTFFSFFTNYCTFLLSNETKFNINKIWEKRIIYMLWLKAKLT